MRTHITHWVYAILATLASLLGGAVLLPFVRSYPKGLHEFICGLNVWPRTAFTFFLCSLVIFAMYRAFSPRPGHVGWRLLSHPPVWLGILLGVVAIAVLDTKDMLDDAYYHAASWEWWLYGCAPLLLAIVHDIWSKPCEWGESLSKFATEKRPSMRSARSGEVSDSAAPEQAQAAPSESPSLTLETIREAKWEVIEDWLRSDEPAKYDFLNHRAIADRLSRRLQDGVRSVGIIGPFGMGKSTLVKWLSEKITKGESKTPPYIVCYFSCWGFDTSARAIHDMLDKAIRKVGAFVDTFHIVSLPDAYREQFADIGPWSRFASKLVLRKSDTSEQLERLSKLLESLDTKLVLIVEDLDRADTKSFEVQEMLGLLERLKDHKQLAFVLTGGLSSTREFDFTKLCDHIEYLVPIKVQHSSALVTRVCKRCLDINVFPHETLGSDHQLAKWHPLTENYLSEYEELAFVRAVAQLLGSPRDLRHALDRTFTAWRDGLCGEIDLNHLVAMNVLRHAAPGAFRFLLRLWQRLRSRPPQRDPMAMEHLKHIHHGISEDWNKTTENVDWDPKAARVVIETLLPTAVPWLTGNFSPGGEEGPPQGIQEDRYFQRAIREAVGDDEVRDQDVIEQAESWRDSPSDESDLVISLCTSREFGEVWRRLSSRLFDEQIDSVIPPTSHGKPRQTPQLPRQLCVHVTSRICKTHGTSTYLEKEGFATTYGLARETFSSGADYTAWFEKLIEPAIDANLEMVIGLWRWTEPDPDDSPVLSVDRERIRQYILKAFEEALTDADSLIKRMFPNAKGSLEHFAVEFAEADKDPLEFVASLGWLGPILVEGLEKGNLLVAENVTVMFGLYFSELREFDAELNYKVLFDLFGEDPSKVIDILETNVPKMKGVAAIAVPDVIKYSRQAIAQAKP